MMFQTKQSLKNYSKPSLFLFECKHVVDFIGSNKAYFQTFCSKSKGFAKYTPIERLSRELYLIIFYAEVKPRQVGVLANILKIRNVVSL